MRDRTRIHKFVLLALLTAIVIVLQMLGAFIRFGPFSVSLVLMPVVVGAALLGSTAGAWLGLVFGMIVLISGDANPFIAINPVGAVLTVLLKGTIAGFVAGVVYQALTEKSKIAGTIAASVCCPVVNTGLFITASYLFFYDALTEWGLAEGFVNTTAYIFMAVVGINFLFELGVNVILCPVIIRLIEYGQKTLIK